ncbi:Recombinational DNA repair protein [Elusimicrobium minutum Pei191]|uniref:Recombination protein RecR n=1 Tax=Elusimicrobium minutum (strain Pei191) TaxID=445932 RepID=B2KES1_ELUMP|nr:recombination mediator RecR [Elusimicrobium minutum]ACC99017.1 Recombinational DNA repair protein [Elusimicrobium minutum Pei191]
MKSFDRLVRALRRLPGVGPRQAERFSAYFLKTSDSEIDEFINALSALRENIHLCSICFAYSEDGVCDICEDSSRERDIICVVEDPQDIEAIEKTGAFKGLYHVLHGALSPIDGRGVENIKIRELIERIHNSQTPVREVIIATDPDTEGETTALYIADALRGLVDKVSRIGYGVPLGGDLDYLDEMTLTYSLKGRTKL